MTADTDPTNTEPLDILLERAAPPRPDHAAEFAAMAAAARREARRPSRVTKVALGAGIAVILSGTAGIAAAGGLFSWQDWAKDPDVAYAFALPSGRQCEERIVVQTENAAGDGIQTPSVVGAALHDWARQADFGRLVDVEGNLAALDPSDGIPRVEKSSGAVVLPDPAGPDAVMTVLRADGAGLDVVPKTATGPTSDDLYATAVDRGLVAVLAAKAAELGAGDWATSTVLACEPRP